MQRIMPPSHSFRHGCARPRVAFLLATSGHSGVDRLARNLLPSMAARGLNVDLLKVRNHGPYLDNGRPTGVNIVDLGCSHAYSSVGAVARYLRMKRPDVLFADKDRINRVAILAKGLSGVKTRLILSTGTTISVDLAHRGLFERYLQRFSIRYLYRFADKVVVTSKGVADDMIAYTGLDADKIEVVPCPVVASELFLRRQPIPDHPWYRKGLPPVILAVGELCYRKDVPTILRAFALARKETRCRLVILGRGKEKERLIALASDLGIMEDVSFAGFQLDPYPYMAHSAVLAHAARWEGLGFVIIEALALGTPVVATDCPSGPAEILKNGLYGPLVPVGNHELFASALLKTLANPLPAAFLQNAARPYEISVSTSAYLKVMGLPEAPFRAE